ATSESFKELYNKVGVEATAEGITYVYNEHKGEIIGDGTYQPEKPIINPDKPVLDEDQLKEELEKEEDKKEDPKKEDKKEDPKQESKKASNNVKTGVGTISAAVATLVASAGALFKTRKND
ncbi:MAG: hypothetical protein Q4B52_03925, partial [Tissierellia bacterium]|nr:hypothetical protein [Tissierellia bacterium]